MAVTNKISSLSPPQTSDNQFTDFPNLRSNKNADDTKKHNVHLPSPVSSLNKVIPTLNHPHQPSIPTHHIQSSSLSPSSFNFNSSQKNNPPTHYLHDDSLLHHQHNHLHHHQPRNCCVFSQCW